jgi:hypothetical protein
MLSNLEQWKRAHAVEVELNKECQEENDRMKSALEKIINNSRLIGGNPSQDAEIAKQALEH